MSTALSLLALMAVGGPSLQSLLDEIRIEQEVPGISVAVACHGEIIFASGSGVADIEKNIEMTADTQLYVGSLSKIFTTILALQLVEQGQLALDETIADIAVESTKLGEGIRIAHLLTHASGLEREGDFGYWFSGEFPDASALASFLHNTELREPPGTSIHYSNLGYAHLGALIARANESSYFDALQSQLLDPLGMMSSLVCGTSITLDARY
jgi:CubicO group peptidase (beta-lactamase class C family)